MHAVGSSVQTGHTTGQSQSLDQDTVGQTKHWTQSRTVRAVAGAAVLGALTGLALSFLASYFVALIAAAAVTVVSAIIVAGYISYHDNKTITPAFSAAINLMPRKHRSTPAADSSNQPHISPENIRTQEEHVKRLLAGYGYGFYRSSLDGNCFYDSIAHQCPEIARNAEELRRMVADFACQWQRSYPNLNSNYSPLETSAYHRLLNDVGNEVPARLIATGLEEIATPGHYSDQIDAYFAAQVTRRPIVIINRDGEVNLAVNENGDSIDWAQNFNPELFPPDTIVLVHDGAGKEGHFMGKLTHTLRNTPTSPWIQAPRGKNS